MIKEQSNMILGQDMVYSLDTYSTKRNNNVLVVGASGAGKTRGIVSPNLMQATGSYIVSDPKGSLYDKYKKYLEERGYVVKKLDFTDPLNSVHYNFLSYISEPQDIIKAAHMLAYEDITTQDPFWDHSASMLLSSLIAYCIENLNEDEQNFRSIEKLLQNARRDPYSSSEMSVLDRLMDRHEKLHPDSWAVRQYKNVSVAPERTYNSILITLTSKMRNFGTEEITEMMKCDDVDIASIGKRKTALFVVVSDSDRSMDNLANLFFTQAMNELCRYADKKCKNYRLPVPVRFILDDFATNCRIDEFPRMIASIRSRGISTMLMIQAESQLLDSYGQDGHTIIGNCDTYVYMGGNDVDTAKAVAERCDLPVKKILNMPVGKGIIFRRGEAPSWFSVLDLKEYEEQNHFVNRPYKETRTKDDRSLRTRLLGKKQNGEKISMWLQRESEYDELVKTLAEKMGG